MDRTGRTSVSFTKCFLIPILLASAQCFCVTGILVTSPEDRVAILGETIKFKCSTDEKFSINWQHILFHSGSVPLDVYISRVVVSPYYGRFSVETKDLRGNATEYNLIISNVQKEDAGTYICIDHSGMGQRKEAQLTVIDSHPKCSSNIDSNGIIGENDCEQPTETISVSCSLEYRGSIVPVSQWLTSQGSLLSIAPIMNITEDSLSSDLSMNASMSMNGISIIWQLVEFPHINWTSNSIKILYAVKNVSTVIVGLNESVVCSAISSENCSYSWVARTHPNEIEIIKGPVLAVDRPGTYQCEAICPLRNTVCSVTSLYVEYSVSTTAQSSNLLRVGPLVIIGVLSVLMLFIILIMIRERRRSIRKENEYKRLMLDVCKTANDSQNTDNKSLHLLKKSYSQC